MKKNWEFAVRFTAILGAVSGVILWYEFSSEILRIFALPSPDSMGAFSLFLTFVIVPIAVIIALYFFFKYANKKMAEIKRQRAEKLRQENEKNLFDSLTELPFSLLALEYMHRCGLTSADTKETEKRAVEIYLQSLISRENSWSILPKEDLLKITQKISHANYDLGRSFCDLIANQCLKNDAPELIFSSYNPWFGKLPILFQQSSKKKEIIDFYLENEVTRRVMEKLMYNDVKKEFRPFIFEGLVRSLAYSYEKSWDEDTLRDLVSRIQEILDFAASCLPSLRSATNRNNLFNSIKEVMVKLDESEIDIKNPLK